MKNQIIFILQEIRPEFDFTQSENFLEEGFLDSFDVVRLVSELDNKFGISIDGTDILPENFSNIDKIIGLLNKNGVHHESKI